ncbi:MAG: D-alanyl-D-alanine carboxypeptidase family protein [Patescibacteria group bacterium]
MPHKRRPQIKKILPKTDVFIIFVVALTVYIVSTYRDYSFGWIKPLQKTEVQFLVSARPIPKSNFSNPQVSARHIFVMDRASKTVLWNNRAEEVIFPASTTKMMTALVALDAFSLDRQIEVTREYPLGQYVGFKQGDKLTVDQLLYALLIQSGNDAAEILAENFEGGRPAFIAAMNEKAKGLRLFKTHFVNPSGLDEYGQQSSAIDLARLADLAMEKYEFAKIVAMENAVITTEGQDQYIVKNVNELLGKVSGVLGVKTGYTVGAGQSLVTLVNRDGHEVILSVLGSDDRFSDTKKLIDWVYENFTWVVPDPHTQELPLGRKP